MTAKVVEEGCIVVKVPKVIVVPVKDAVVFEPIPELIRAVDEVVEAGGKEVDVLRTGMFAVRQVETNA